MPQPKGCEKPAGSGKPQGHPVGRPIGALGKELKPRKSAISQDRKDFEAMLNGAVPLFDNPVQQIPVDPVEEEFMSPEDILGEAKMKLAYMSDEDAVKRWLVREAAMDEKAAAKAVSALKKELAKEFNDYIKSYSKDNIMAIRYMLKGALKRNDLRNATDILKALDYMTTKYVENTGVGTNEIEIAL